MIDEPVAVGVLEPTEDEVAEVVARYNLLAVPVVDDERPARRHRDRRRRDRHGRCRRPGSGACPARLARADRDATADSAAVGGERPGLTHRVAGSRGRGDRPARPGSPRSRLPRRSPRVLRLRGRFRRRGLLAFLAVMGPGLIAGIAGNDAGGITTYSRDGRARPASTLLWIFPITIVDPRGRPGDGRPAGRGHRPGPVRPHPRPVRRPLDASSRWSCC